jgi:penicillin-binding protein 1A
VIKRIFLALVILLVGVVALVSGFAYWGYYYITRDLPKLSRIEDYKPPAVTRVVADDGTLLAEFYVERRYPAKLHEVPEIVRKAFLASEDASFYSHKGIDPMGILRAAIKNFQSGNVKQGGSTITQQVVKNLLLTSERKYERKLKEAFLAYQLEKRFSKDEIFEIYLNQIFFGNSAYGIKAASRLYFHKELSELTLAEGAMLAGLPQAPSDYSPVANFDLARRRQRYVLEQMVKAGFVTRAEADDAYAQRVPVYPAGPQNVFGAPFFVREIRRVFSDRWPDLDLDRDGLELVATVDLAADAMASSALRAGLREVDKRRGWRGPRAHFKDGPEEYQQRFGGAVPTVPELDTPYPALVTRIVRDRGALQVLVGGKTTDISLNDVAWAKKLLSSERTVSWGTPLQLLRVGDVIEVSFSRGEGENAPLVARLDQTPDIEGALVLINPHTGEVKAMAGGYDYTQSQFNRVTQSLRQPGSAFKPIVYLAALDKYRYTPSTIVQDVPRTFRVGDTFWTPANFDETFLGPITLRSALEKSRNLVSADIISRIGADAAIHYARVLGIQSPLGRNLSLSLGSSEVTPLEITRAYGVLTTQGLLSDSVFVARIKDRFGATLYDAIAEQPNRIRNVLDSGSAFVLTHMMRGVIDYGTGFKIKALGRPVAGKTGTSNDQMDAWFVGYTPKWVAGVWVGFDQKTQIGAKETGGMVSAPIWLNFMQRFLKHSESLEKATLERDAKEQAESLGIRYQAPTYQPVIEFPVPSTVVPYLVDKHSGVLAGPESPGGFLEYFRVGTEPPKYVPPEESEGEDTESYLESPDL